MLNKREIVLAIDTMGSEAKIDCFVEAASDYKKSFPDRNISFRFFGDKVKLEKLLKKDKRLIGSTFEGSESVVLGDTSVMTAVRMKTSSMSLAIASVRTGLCDGVLSAGNTGALMAISKLILKTLPGIDRPAIAKIFPDFNGRRPVMLDLGANVECSSDSFVQFAIIGSIISKLVLKVKKPKVGLLNIGTEHIKGKDSLRAAHMILTNFDSDNFDFIGFVEGNDIVYSDIDVIATDGFTGNVALKTMEGLSKYLAMKLQSIIKKSFICAFVFKVMGMRKALKSLFDPRNHNGAMIVGLNGVVIKSHSNADKISIFKAIDYSYEVISSNLNAGLLKELNKVNLDNLNSRGN